MDFMYAVVFGRKMVKNVVFWKMKIAAVLLQVLLLVAATSATHLTRDNFDAASSGKTLFIKFYAPWCGHCKKLAPDWSKLTKAYEGSSTGLVAEVDCTTAQGKGLCADYGVKGYPTLKWGTAGQLVPYQGGRSFKDLKLFADENLKPQCSPDNMHLCDDKQKMFIEDMQKLSEKELDALIEEKEVSVVATVTMKDSAQLLQRPLVRSGFF